MSTVTVVTYALGRCDPAVGDAGIRICGLAHARPDGRLDLVEFESHPSLHLLSSSSCRVRVLNKGAKSGPL